MNIDHQTSGDQELDQWLTTAMAALHANLDNVLDLDAGLADARLPGRHNTLVHAVDDVLDLDAGLSHILPTAPATEATRPADIPSAATTLHTYTTEFAKRPPPARLAARVWFPRQELAALRAITRLAIRSRGLTAFADNMREALNGMLVDVLDIDVTLGDDLTRARNTATRDDGFALAVAEAFDAALARALAGAREAARGAARVLGEAHTTMFGNSYPPGAFGAEAFAFEALGLAIADARALDAALANTTPDLDDLTDTIKQLEDAVTNVVGADLTSVKLHGIPLAGVRWSRETRWPVRWQDQIQRDSVEIEPGLYEIRPGTATGINITAYAPA